MPRLRHCFLGKNKIVTQQQRVCRWSIAVAAPREVANMKHLNQFSDMMKNEDDKEERRLLLTAYLFRFLLQLQVEIETKNQTEYPGINVEIVVYRKYSFEIMKCSRSHVFFFIQRMFWDALRKFKIHSVHDSCFRLRSRTANIWLVSVLCNRINEAWNEFKVGLFFQISRVTTISLNFLIVTVTCRVYYRFSCHISSNRADLL